MPRTSLVWLCVIALLLCGCTDENPVAEKPPTASLDDLVIANCYAVQEAVEAYAVDHDGFYPPGQNIGMTLVPYLPQAIRLENPYTNLLTEPAFPTAVFPGQTGYRAYYAYGDVVGYLITGFGKDGELVRISNLPRGAFDLDELAIANCDTLLDAVEQFAAENRGVYSSDVCCDATGDGNTLTDLLPDGRLMTNPYTMVQTEPIDGPAAVPGETGYQPVVAGVVEAGCRITGFGRYETIIVLGPWSPEDETVRDISYRLAKAVEDFASENYGVYPDDVDTDVSLSGKTVLDYNGGLKQNPYTLENTEPRNGLVTTRGHVGYVPGDQGPPNIGYTINGWGLFKEVARIEK